MSIATAVSFKWLDILEKEFDKAFINLDLILGDLDIDGTDIICLARKQLATLCSCFAQLSHKALTMFQINAKTEAQLVNLRSEVVELKTTNQLTENRLHSILLQWHQLQLDKMSPKEKVNDGDTNEIRSRLKKDLEQHSPVHVSYSGNVDRMIMSLENWRRILQAENETLRSSVVGLQAEVCGARLAARYLDKELVGRIQQLQLLSGNNMSAEVRTKLWDQLDEEILLQRHKTVIKVMQDNHKNCMLPPDGISMEPRVVEMYRDRHKGLGISVTGGREHEIPVLISELEPWCFNKNLYIGDAILNVNKIDLTNLTHKEAVKILNNQIGKVTLTVRTLPRSIELEDDSDSAMQYGYPFFEGFEKDNQKNIYSYYDKIRHTGTKSQTSVYASSDNLTSKIHNLKPEDQNESENDIFGVTTLQKILRTTSSIEKCETVVDNEKDVVSSSPEHNMCQKSMARSASFSNETSKMKDLPRKHLCHVQNKSVAVTGIGDATLGTPV